MEAASGILELAKYGALGPVVGLLLMFIVWQVRREAKIEKESREAAQKHAEELSKAYDQERKVQELRVNEARQSAEQSRKVAEEMIRVLTNTSNALDAAKEGTDQLTRQLRGVEDALSRRVR
jgi:phage I-like protein